MGICCTFRVGHVSSFAVHGDGPTLWCQVTLITLLCLSCQHAAFNALVSCNPHHALMPLLTLITLSFPSRQRAAFNVLVSGDPHHAVMPLLPACNIYVAVRLYFKSGCHGRLPLWTIASPIFADGHDAWRLWSGLTTKLCINKFSGEFGSCIGMVLVCSLIVTDVHVVNMGQCSAHGGWGGHASDSCMHDCKGRIGLDSSLHGTVSPCIQVGLRKLWSMLDIVDAHTILTCFWGCQLVCFVDAPAI
jgi:hypothetical protein